MHDLLERTRTYFAALEGGATSETLAGFYAPDVVQEEFPNRLNPSGARRNLAAILAGAERGQKIMSSQRYEVLNLVARDEQVAVEFRWTGKLAIAVGSLAAGNELHGRFACFLQFRAGQIVAQRNYDCFEP